MEDHLSLVGWVNSPRMSRHAHDGLLLRNQHKLVTKEEPLDAVWSDIAVSENSLTRSIALLRKLLSDDTHEPRYIAIVPNTVRELKNI